METKELGNPPALWIPMKDPIELAHIGKLGEEAAELAAICARITIQGIDGIDPDNGKVNRKALQHEIADVYAMAALCTGHFRLDVDKICLRETRKKTMKRTWHQMLREALGCA